MLAIIDVVSASGNTTNSIGRNAANIDVARRNAAFSPDGNAGVIAEYSAVLQLLIAGYFAVDLAANGNRYVRHW